MPELGIFSRTFDRPDLASVLDHDQLAAALAVAGGVGGDGREPFAVSSRRATA